MRGDPPPVIIPEPASLDSSLSDLVQGGARIAVRVNLYCLPLFVHVSILLKKLFLLAALVLALAMLPAGIKFWVDAAQERQSTDRAAARLQLPPLRVGMMVHPTIYFIDPAGEPAGFEYELVAAFARTQRREIKISTFTTPEEARKALMQGELDMVAVGSSQREPSVSEEATQVRYFETPWLLLHAPQKFKPKSLHELLPRQVVVSVRLLQHPQLAELKRQYPRLEFIPDPHQDDEALLAAVGNDEIAYALVEQATFEAARHFHYDTELAFTIGSPQARVWLFPATQGALREQADLFLRRIVREGLITRVHDRYFGFPGRVKPMDLEIFTQRVETLLPRYRAWFHEAQDKTGIEWRLLAALAYQESHWNADAVSETGVRGFMQLTEDTARRLGVTDRGDPKQSILGGARYLAMIRREQIPERVQEPDKTFLALAAYNIGPGHLENARILTARMGRNPDLWVDVRKGLTQLARPEVAAQFKLGPCRCFMPIELVESVRAYYDVLLRLEAPHQPRLQLRS